MNIILIGAQASGKMTIGQELEKLTDLTLFHNHESIDFVTKFIPMSSEARELIDELRLLFLKHLQNVSNQLFLLLSLILMHLKI
ncbi:shikimate kinase [Streptococcus equi subsp. equi]|nr:shikimate kinase [Streptococcus equi subsp. equi]